MIKAFWLTNRPNPGDTTENLGAHLDSWGSLVPGRIIWEGWTTGEMDEEAWLFLWILNQLGTKGDSYPDFSNLKVHGNHLEFVKLQVLMQEAGVGPRTLRF